MCSGPEHDGAERVEAESHDDREAVASALQDLSGDRREDEVTATEVHDLETGRFETGDAEDRLEVLVQDLWYVSRNVSKCGRQER